MGARGCLYTCMHSVQHTCTASFADGSLQTVHIRALCCLVLLRADLTRIPALCCLLLRTAHIVVLCRLLAHAAYISYARRVAHGYACCVVSCCTRCRVTRAVLLHASACTYALCHLLVSPTQTYAGCGAALCIQNRYARCGACAFIPYRDPAEYSKHGSESNVSSIV